MSRYTGPKAKLCRREGMNIIGTAKYTKILTRKNYPPGSHGKRGLRKLSEYASQLREKQKLSRMFGLSRKQLTNYYKKANSMTGATSDNLLELIEKRLDNVIYRAGLALTRYQARQFASHGLFMVNGKRVTIPSIIVKAGDKIEVRPRSKTSKVFADIQKENAKYRPPSWLTVDVKKLLIDIKDVPTKDHFEQAIDAQKIVEFYSK
jgi:small subunit ribosomal protein S4